MLSQEDDGTDFAHDILMTGVFITFVLGVVAMYCFKREPIRVVDLADRGPRKGTRKRAATGRKVDAPTDNYQSFSNDELASLISFKLSHTKFAITVNDTVLLRRKYVMRHRYKEGGAVFDGST